MKRILVPTDFSACARAAENLAIAMAAKGGLEIDFLHIVSTPVEWLEMPTDKNVLYPAIKARLATAEEELDDLIAEASRHNVRAKKFLLHDATEHQVIEHVREFSNDLIIMGTHGRSGLKGVLGSNAARMVRNSTIPVLVVKNQCWLEQIKHLVFASTFEEEVDKPFDIVREIAKLIGAKIHLLYVNTPSWFAESDDVLRRMTAFQKSNNAMDADTHIFDGLNEERGIRKFASSNAMDMIALTTHGRKGVLRFISPSITEALVNHSEIPVLSINIYQDENEE